MNYKIFILSLIPFLSTQTHIAGGFPELFLKKKELVSDESQKQIRRTEEKVSITTKDGIKRSAILSLKSNAKANVVLCHPATHNKEYMKDYEEKLFKDYNCIRFDFRRHGENSENQYSTIGVHEAYEVEAAAKLLKEKKETKNLPIYGFGVSLGAAALIKTESRNHIFDALILQSCFENLKTQIRRMFTFYRVPLMDNLIFTSPVSYYAKTRYRIKLKRNKPVNEIKNIKAPIFLIHAKNDTFIPIDAFNALEKAAISIKKIWTPEDGKHTNILETYPELYSKKCGDFLDSLRQ